MASSVSSVYLHVIDDVVSKVREEFVNSGAGESVLNELQAIWETKMMQFGAISPSMERPSLAKHLGPITHVHDLNVPAVEEYETPTAEMLFPPTPLQTPVPQTPIPQTPVQTPFPGTEQVYNIPIGPSDYAPTNDVRNGQVTAGRSSPYMHPPSPRMNERPLGVDVNVAYVEGRDEVDKGPLHQPTPQDFFMMSSWKRKRDDYAPHLDSRGYMPQQDGSGDIAIEFFVPKESQLPSTRLGNKATIDMQSKEESVTAPLLPQKDGVNDEYDDLFHFQGVAHEDYNTPTSAERFELRSPTPHVGTPKPNKNDDVEDDEPPLNEDDDDDEDLHDFDQGEEPNTEHLILAQFEKVTRTKSRWKCTLKDGIMHINKDILFNKANGEFDF